jgi:hypothetical protein
MVFKDDSERCAPWNRLINGHPLLVDLQELRQMSETDLSHYASTPGGVKAYFNIKR